jgi:hypothetical protein
VSPPPRPSGGGDALRRPSGQKVLSWVPQHVKRTWTLSTRSGTYGVEPVIDTCLPADTPARSGHPPACGPGPGIHEQQPGVPRRPVEPDAVLSAVVEPLAVVTRRSRIVAAQMITDVCRPFNDRPVSEFETRRFVDSQAKEGEGGACGLRVVRKPFAASLLAVPPSTQRSTLTMRCAHVPLLLLVCRPT